MRSLIREVEINKMLNIVVLVRQKPIVNCWSEELNNIIRCVKIREMKFLVMPIEKDITAGRY